MAQQNDIPGSLCVPEVGLLAALKWSRNAKEQGHLKQRIKDLPSLLKNGFNFRKKQADVMASSEKNAETHPSNSKRKIYSETIYCAGLALRDFFIALAPQLINDRVTSTGKYKRSCVGFEMVDWLQDQCLFILNRTNAESIWQILLEMGILSSATGKQQNFQDEDAYYQFSRDECDVPTCPFGEEEEWKNGVRLLAHMVPLVQSRTTPLTSEQESEDEKAVPCDEVLQLQALALLSATVKKELAAVIASKGGTSLCEQEDGSVLNHQDMKGSANEIEINKDAVVCSLQKGEELDHIGLVHTPPAAANVILTEESYHILPVVQQDLSKILKQNDEVNTVRMKERGQDALVLKKVSSASPAPTAGSAQNDWRYVVVSGTPEKILEHLLNDLHLEEGECKETDILLDDFLLTYTVFMSTNDLSQALLRHYCSKPYAERPGHTNNSLYQKRKVLRIVSQWVSLYKNLLREDENTKLLLKNLYKCVLDDLFEYPGLEKELKELQNLFRIPRRHTIDEYSPHKKNTTVFHQLSCREKWLHPKGCPGESDEVFCRVYMADHSYISFWTKESTSAQEVLHAVAGKLQKPEQDLMLVAVTSSEERQILQPDDVSVFKSLDATTRIFICRKDSSDFLTLIAEDEEAPHRSIRMLGMNTWHLANELTSFDWDLFNCICEQELICYIYRRQDSGRSTVNLNLLLQRCNEVQLWVATEVLLCSQLSKRVQLVKKFIKIAAHCRALRNLNSFFAIIMGLNSAAVCRLGQTWEKVPGKFKRLFSELENLTDPSLNHKAYRDAFKKMQAPKIPFMPLLLKDVTFIHEGNKTFLDNLVNFQKLHMIADTVRLLRHCRSNQSSTEGTYKEHQDVKTYTQHLHIIDNQQMLFQLSHRLEPRT